MTICQAELSALVVKPHAILKRFYGSRHPIQHPKSKHICRSGLQEHGETEPDRAGRELSEEFSRLVDPGRLERERRHLELKFQVSKRSKPCRCECCGGLGEVECAFCHGTGVLTLGDQLVCSLDGCKGCPVCKRKGFVGCSFCNSTGFRASWMGKPQCNIAPDKGV